jgi:hypothetical protein
MAMSDRPRTRAPLKPSQLILVLGVLAALISVASGIVGAVEGWYDKSRVGRPVFLDVPDPLQVAFYTLLPLLILWAAWQLSLRARNWERGAAPTPTAGASTCRPSCATPPPG